MITTIRREPAKIYAFPPRGSLAPNGRRVGNLPAAGAAAPQVALVDFGSGWYHQAAVQEAEQKRKS